MKRSAGMFLYFSDVRFDGQLVDTPKRTDSSISNFSASEFTYYK